MTLDEFIHLTDAKGRSGKWRAKCPAHKSRGLTLAIYDDGDGKIGVYCMAGCNKDDVLKELGLTWKDLYPKKEWLSSEEFKAQQRKKEAQEARERIRKRKISKLIDEVRTWETTASLLHAQLMRDLFNKELAVLWRRSLATARARNEELRELWPECPDVQAYHLWRITPDVSERFIGTQIGEVLGCLGAVGY